MKRSPEGDGVAQATDELRRATDELRRATDELAQSAVEIVRAQSYQTHEQQGGATDRGKAAASAHVKAVRAADEAHLKEI